MSARSGRGRGWAGVVVGALFVGYLGLFTLGAYVFGGAVIDAMRAQQTADLMATLPHQEMVMATVAQERALATVVGRSCASANPGCAAADQARTALLDGVPELDQDGEPVVADGKAVFAQPSALQQTVMALDQRDQALAALDVEMLDPQVLDAIELMAGDRPAIDQLHDTVETAPEQAVEAYDQYLQNAAGVSESLAEASDGELRGRLDAQRLLTDLMLASLQERPLVALSLGAFEVGQPGYLEPAVAQVAVVDGQLVEAQEALEQIGWDQQVPPVDGDLAAVRSAVTSGDLDGLTPAQAQAFTAGSASWGEELRPIRDAVRTEALELAGDRAGAATNQALLTGGITGVVLILGLGAVVIIAVLLLHRRRTPPAPLEPWQPQEPARADSRSTGPTSP